MREFICQLLRYENNREIFSVVFVADLDKFEEGLRRIGQRRISGKLE